MCQLCAMGMQVCEPQYFGGNSTTGNGSGVTATNDILALTGANAESRWNFHAGLGTAAVVTYSFPDTIPDYLTGADRWGWRAFGERHQADARAALEVWGAQGGISFVEVPADIGGAISFQFVDIYDDNPFDLDVTLGYAYQPFATYRYDSDLGTVLQRNSADDVDGDVFMNRDVYGNDPFSLDDNGEGFSILLHEIGHAIGFKHPFQGDPVINPANDYWENTVLTYAPPANDGQIGVLDKQALAYVYGTHDLNGSWDETYDAVVQHGRDTNSDETLVGWDKNDIVYANAGDDTIFVYDGKDRVFDGAGDDRVYLGEGNDYVRVGGGEDGFYGGQGNDYISYYDSTKGVTLNFETQAVSGGWAVNDTIFGFESGAGSRTGADRIYGSDAANTIRTYGGNDKVYAEGGSDNVMLGSGNDYVRVGGGTESFFGGSGVDYISYYDSSNGVRLDLRDDEASGSWAVNDVIDDFESASGSKTGDDVLLGTNGATVFRSYGGDDKLYGRSGDDKLYGGSGNDFFDGGADTDTLYGGTGADTFHFDKGEDVDVVKDFENNIDVIELDGFAASFDPFDFAQQLGNHVVFDFGGGDRLTIENVTIGQLVNDLDVV